MAFNPVFKWGAMCFGVVLVLGLVTGCGDEGDITSPRLTISAIGSPTNKTPLTLSGTIEEGATVEISVTPAPTTIGPVILGDDNSWSSALELPDSPFTLYSVAVSAADRRGNRSTAQVNFIFDNQPPQMDDFGPDGSIEAPAEIFVVFSESMQKEAAETPGAMTVTAEGVEIAGSVNYDEATRKAVFVADEALTAGVTYTVTLDASLIEDLAGNLLQAENTTWTFIVAANSPVAGE